MKNIGSILGITYVFRNPTFSFPNPQNLISVGNLETLLKPVKLGCSPEWKRQVEGNTHFNRLNKT